ncbi:MAG: WXG100 family type VII secretion target [Actinomadura sp.]
MTLNIKVEGDPAELRATAYWLRETAEETGESAREVHLARAESQDGWAGPASEGFRSVMEKVRSDVADLAADLEHTAAALTAYADALEGCRSGMARAREIAHKAGLRTTDTEIYPPGKPPTAPQELGYGPYVGEKARIYEAYKSARAHYAVQVKAYVEAAIIASSCRKQERHAQNVLLDFLGNFNQSSPFVASDFTTGLAGAVMARNNRFLLAAARWNQHAKRALLLMGHPEIPGRPDVFKALVIERARALQETRAHEQRALNTKLARAIGQKKPARILLDPEVPNAKLRKAPYLGKVAAGATKNIPVLGWLITGSVIAKDVAQGKDPVKATASGVGGTIAGSAAGGAVAGSVGGPVGTVAGLVVGAIVGAGVGYSIDQWGDDVVDGIKSVG